MSGYPTRQSRNIVLTIIVMFGKKSVLIRREARSADREQRGRTFSSTVSARIQETTKALQVVKVRIILLISGTMSVRTIKLQNRARSRRRQTLAQASVLQLRKGFRRQVEFCT